MTGPPKRNEPPNPGRDGRLAIKGGPKPSSNGSSPQPDQQEVLSLEELDALIEASKDCERAMARRQLMQRRMTLNLTVYRDNLLELGKAVWRDAA